MLKLRREAQVFSSIANVYSSVSVRGMAKKFTCRLMGFGFSEMEKNAAKFEAKYLSTGPQRFSSSQHKSQSQMPLTQQHSISQHKTQYQKLLTQQHTERYGVAIPTMKNQLQCSHSESLSESEGFSKKSKHRKRREQKEAMLSKSHINVDSESEGFSGLSKCTEQLQWDEVMRILEASSKGHITLSDEQKTVLEAVSRSQSVFVTGSAGTGKSYLLAYIVRILKEMQGPG